MTTPNSSTYSNENTPEIPESKKKDQTSKLVERYVASKTPDTKKRYQFTKQVQKSKKLPDSMRKEIAEYAEKHKEFDGADVENITIDMVRKELGGYAATLYTKNMSLRDILLGEYDVSPQEYAQKIAPEVENISSEQELNALISSESARRSFLKKVYKKNKMPSRKFFQNIFEHLNIPDRFSKLPEHEQVALRSVIHKFQKREKIELYDAITLFDTAAFTKDEQRKILESFIPSLTLKDYIDLDVITLPQAFKIKKGVLAHILGVVELDPSYDSYISDIPNSEIRISTSEFFRQGGNFDKLVTSQRFFEKMTQEVNTTIEKAAEKISRNSIQTLAEMQEILSPYSHIEGLENFKTGGTLIIEQVVKNPETNQNETTQVYAEILSVGTAGTFTILERGTGSYDRRFANSSQSSRQSYSEFIDYATKQSATGNPPTSIQILSPEELKLALSTGAIKDANGHKHFDSKIEIDQEIKDITQQIEKRKEELRKQRVPKADRYKDPKLKKLYEMRDAKHRVEKNIAGSNFEKFIQRMDEIDAEGKTHGLESGVSFRTKDGDAYTIMNVNTDLEQITLKGLGKEERATYEQFLETFKEKGATRISKIRTYDDLVAKNNIFGDYIIEDGELRKKDSKTKVNFDYLVPPTDAKSNQTLKIHDIDNGWATVSFGTAKTETQKSKNEKDDDQKIDVIATEKQEYRITLGVLESYISENKLTPRSLDEGKIVEEQQNNIPKAETQFNALSFFMQGMSFATLVKGGSLGIEQIKNMLAEGVDQQASQFALKAFGPLIGKQGRIDMMSRLEQTEKKNMDEMIERLKGINSAEATELIESWLKDPYCAQYKQDAAVSFMLEKYGALCCKGALYKYQGKFFWYQRLGGKIGDEVWVERHAVNARTHQNTTEEELVYYLIKKQTRSQGFNNVKRRSKLDKELKAMRGDGKSGEWDTGVKDGGSERDVQDRLDGGLNELSSGNYPNAMGWLETVIEKGGTMYQMNMIPFVMIFSGMAYRFEHNLLDKIKNFISEARMVPMTRFMSYEPDLDLMNETIVEVSKKLSQKGGKYANMHTRAKKIFDVRKSNTVNDSKKQELAISFYKDYGEKLTNILYMLNTGDVEDTDNKMIFFEKENNSTFQRYYDALTTHMSNEGLYGASEERMSDAFAQKGTSGMNIYKATKELLETRTGGWIKKHAGPIMWKEIVQEFKAIPKRTYHDDPDINEQMQKKLLESNLRQMLAALTGLYSDSRALTGLNNPVGPFSQFNTWGIYMNELYADNASPDSLQKPGGNQKLINKFVQNIINVEKKNADYSKKAIDNGSGGYTFVDENEESSEVSGVGSLIKGDTQKIISQKKPVTPQPSSIIDDD